MCKKRKAIGLNPIAVVFLALAFLLAIGATGYADCVAFFDFEEPEGRICYDTSGYGNHATIGAGPFERVLISWASISKGNHALQLDEDTDEFVIPDSESLQVTAGVTMTAWFYFFEDLYDDCAINKDDRYRLTVSGWTGENKVQSRVILDLGGGDDEELNIEDASESMEVGRWYFVAMTYDTSTGQLRSYQDAEIVDEMTRTDMIGVPIQQTDDDIEMFGRSFNGYVDKIAIYNVAFSQEEIKAIYKSKSGWVKNVPVVSNISPEDGEEHVPPDANICFQASEKALCMYEFDPCEPEVGPPDPNFKGPFEYDVYFGTEPNVLTMTQLASAYTPAECNDVMCFDPCEEGDLNPGTDYFWRVDITDLNEPGDPCFYEGSFFSFITWGLAYDEVPPDGEEDVDTGTVELKWTGDDFVGAAGTGYDIYFPDDTFIKYQDCGTADANKYTPTQSLVLGEEYCWRVDEVNVVTIEGHVWCFSTSLCSTWETFEDYADGDAIRAVWVDGWTNDTGSYIYLGKESDDEPVYGGDQSMQYYYDNISDIYPNPFYSESTRTFDPTVDWRPESDIAPGARALRIWFHDTDEDGAGAAQMYVKLYDGTTEGRVDFDPDTSVIEEDETEVDDEDILWIGWSIALSDFGVELSTIESMTIGFDEKDTEGTVFLDTFQLCARRCIPDQAPWSWNDDCETEWDELEDGISENWLAMDEWVLVEEPCDANLLVEYLFDNNDLTDTANSYNGIGVNEPNIHDGLMTLDGNDWVIVPISGLELFQGDKSWTVVMDAAPDNVGVMFGVSREPWGLNAYGEAEYYYDPCICNDPCEPDVNYCDAGLPPYPWEDTHALVFYQEEGGVVGERYEFGDVWFEKDDEWGESYQVVVVYDVEDPEESVIYIDEEEGDTGMDGDPNVPDPGDDTVSIGHVEHIAGLRPGEEMDMYNVRANLHWMGDIDNFRIYDYALSYGEILGLVFPEEIGTEHAFLLDTDSNVDEQTINYEDHDRQIVNLKDFALMAEHWLEDKEWWWPYE